MQITAIKTPLVTTSSVGLLELLNTALEELPENSILAVSSKIVALCEGSTAPKNTDFEALVIKESDLYLPKNHSKYGHHFTITDSTVIASAGIDQSNGNGSYVLWPKDSQAAANQVWAYLRQRFGLQKVGVVITDSTSQPMRRGVTGIAMAHSGFASLNNYIGQSDLFGKRIGYSQANISGGLAAAAVLAMGEGSEQTPLCLLTDLPFVQFQDRLPNAEELAVHHMPIEDDLFAPFLETAGWLPGRRQDSQQH